MQRWQELNRVQLSEQLPHSLVVIPTGATEQHGLHLATGHDSFTVEHIAVEAARQAQRSVIVAPTVTIGSSAHHVPFGGSLSLSTETYYRVIREIVESAIQSGARRLFLLNGHGGNAELNQLVARDVALAVEGVAIAAASYWAIADAKLRALMARDSLPLPGHAGYFETSTMLGLRPELVAERAVRESDPYSEHLAGIPGVRLEQSGSWQVFDGYTDFPHLADGEFGAKALMLIANEVAIAFDAVMD